MRKCDVCNSEFTSVSALANHVRWEHKREQTLRSCIYCGTKVQTANLAAHVQKCTRPRKSCEFCNMPTFSRFCSRKCSAHHNNQTGRTGYRRTLNDMGYHPNRRVVPHYKDICFQYWDRKCVLCEWSVSLDVHHIDGNHENDRPDNLIPLCQNHHTMTRMVEYRDSMKKQLEDLIKANGAIA